MEKIIINHGQWFGDVVPSFKNRVIYNKWITGIGGTTTAIKMGYCIVISPNVSGIISKQEIENVVAVYGGITHDNIESKLREIEKKKFRPAIISTPDSFGKIFDVLNEDVYHRFMCIIDEIHCFQEAASYRDSLPKFLNEHFDRFDRKAVITATYTPLSHPIFKNWDEIQIIPQNFDYGFEIKVYHSEKFLYASVVDYVSKLPQNEKKLIFFNSINGSKSLDRLGLQFETLCSKDSKEKAIRYKEFDGHLGNVTLATCAYYQACDINESAHIIFVIDAHNLPHTILSINQLIQALGRCRQGVLSATIIYKPKNKRNNRIQSEADIQTHVRDLAHENLGAARLMLRDLYIQTESPSERQIQNIVDAFKTSVFDRKMLYYSDDESLDSLSVNWLNLDGETQDRYAAQHYVNQYHLLRYFRSDSRLKVTDCGQYPAIKDAVCDSELQDIDGTNAEILEKLIKFYLELKVKENPTCFRWNVLKHAESTTSEMRNMMVLCERAGACNLLEELKTTEGKRHLIKRIENKIIGLETMSGNLKLQAEVKTLFKEKFYTSKYIKRTLQKIYDKYELKKRAKASDLKNFVEVRWGKEIVFRENGKVKKGYKVGLLAVGIDRQSA